ncbi:MAG: hypothetical protein KBD40_14195 [Phenylobacterium sp.]|nr:hypothetical protein [Phenylobacterium sp.]
MITKEALRILHQKANFIGAVNRQYDDQFAKSGAKIGDSLRIRLPNQYTVRDGATIQVQNTVEQSTTLTVATQKGVDMDFSSAELTMKLDDFSNRIIEPAVNVLVAAVENDFLNTVRKDVYQQVNNTAAAITVASILQGNRKLADSLAPSGNRTALLNTNDEANAVDTMKGLFNDQNAIGKQFREGVMGYALGNTFASNTHLGTQARGTGASYQVNDVAIANGDTTIVIGTGTGTINVGEIFTIDGVYSVQPETKVSTGILQQFVCTAAVAAAGNLSFLPALQATGATQNISALPANTAAITIAGSSNTAYGQSLMFHKDAFTFATADLVMPKGVDMASRQVLDGVSMRLVRAYDINSDRFPCRLDILYGYKTIRPQLATRLANLAPA